MSEETLTEITLFEVARRHQAGNFLVIPATKPQEFVHGVYWLFWFVSGANGISYRVQAKKLFTNGRYESLFKSGKAVDPEEQLKKLISKAQADNHIPLYCFYNFDHPDGDFHKHSNSCLHPYRPPSFWGCSIALAKDVQFAKSDQLKNLRKFMVPWHLLACSTNSKSLLDAATNAGRILAEPKGSASVVEGTVFWERPKLEIDLNPRAVPAYVGDMIEIHQRNRRLDFENPAKEREEIDDRAQDFLEKEELSGVTVFNDTRKIDPKI